MKQYDAEARDLEQLGLSPAEAAIYVALVGKGRASVQTISDLSGLPRSGIYPTLRTLADKGVIEGGAGYGGRFRSVAPEVALTSLIEQQREGLHERERLAKELIERLMPVGDEVEDPVEDVIEILRNRRVIAARFERLQLSALHEIDVLVKAPVIATKAGNPAQEAALRRGVRVRGLYERAALADQDIAPFVDHWRASGEESRLYPGELPLKLALIDGREVLMPLETPAEPHGVTAVLIRHSALGAGLKTLFECLWEQAQPLSDARGGNAGKSRSPTKMQSGAPKPRPSRRRNAGRA